MIRATMLGMVMLVVLFLVGMLITEDAPKRGNQPIPPPALEIEGVHAYFTNGDFIGAVVVSKRPNGAYLFQYVAVGVQQVVGVGMREGNTISVGWGQGNSLGVSVYRIEVDKDNKVKLVGKWTNLNEQGNEELQWLRKLE